LRKCPRGENVYLSCNLNKHLLKKKIRWRTELLDNGSLFIFLKNACRSKNVLFVLFHWETRPLFSFKPGFIIKRSCLKRNDIFVWRERKSWIYCATVRERVPLFFPTTKICTKIKVKRCEVKYLQISTFELVYSSHKYFRPCRVLISLNMRAVLPTRKSLESTKLK